MARLLRMPEIAANAVEAVLSEWPFADHTPFAAGDAIAVVETDKAVVDVPADAAGIVLKTLVSAGTTVPVGRPIAVLGDVGETVDDMAALLAALDVVPQDAASATPAIAAATPNGNAVRIFISPLARRLVREAGLSIEELRGSGPGGRIVRRDVEHAITARQASAVPGAQADPSGGLPAPVPSAGPAVAPDPSTGGGGPTPEPGGGRIAGPVPYQDVPHSRMRRAVAARLTASTREAPHFSVRGSATVDKLLRLRARLNEAGPVKVSINDLVVLAAARAHVLVPAMNVIWTPDAVRSFSTVDVAVAVATDRGLVTPVLRGVDRLAVSAVATSTADLIARARAGRLRQEELEGGTLTVTNLGAYGTEEFTAIINPPQSAILAVGAARQEPVVRKGKLTVGTVLRVTLSVDHRPIDGVVAAQWMAALLGLLQNPIRILA